ncbi:Pectinesterase [Quillaja saponaria]|uniref:pectinesterase n=1 Tax=Quillaja saponaria TaxID=32244 RepID=A0AAD7QBE9_QUISA|nr:Pectinesterase [Quillaja saponaria]
MDSLNFKGYGKVNHVDDEALQHKAATSNKNPLIAAISIFAILSLTLTICLMLGAIHHESKTKSSETPLVSSNSAESIKAICKVTRFPDSCFTSISSLHSFPQKLNDPEAILNLSLQVSINELSKLSSLFKTLGGSNSNKAALSDCQDQIDESLSRLNDSVSAMKVGPGQKILTEAKINDIQTWISSAMTDQETCLDGLEEMESTALVEVKSKMHKSREYTSNSLAIIAHIHAILDEFHMPLH